MRPALLLSLLALLPVTARAEAPQHFPSSPGLPFSEAVQVGDILYLSGQIGVLPGAKAPVPGGIEGEARQTMENIGAALRRRGLGFDDVFKCTVMLADMKDWPAFNAVYVGYFKPDRFPARSAFGATGLVFGAKVELECLAYNPRPAQARGN